MFLITAHPRSGTLYTAKVLQGLGLNVSHESKGKDGCVSWKHLPKALDFDLVMHQVRNPLKVIGSSHTINVRSKITLYGQEDLPQNELRMFMFTWLKWTNIADGIADFIYRIEDLENVFKFILEQINEQGRLSEPIEVTNEIPEVDKDTHSRSHLNKYKELNWGDLFNEDKMLAMQVMQKAKKYGYNINDNN